MTTFALCVLVVLVLVVGLGWWDSRKLRDERRWS